LLILKVEEYSLQQKELNIIVGFANLCVVNVEESKQTGTSFK